MDKEAVDIEWLYNPKAKPAEELSQHDQEMIKLGWDAAKAFISKAEPPLLSEERFREWATKWLAMVIENGEPYEDFEDYEIPEPKDAYYALIDGFLAQAQRQLCIKGG